MVRQDKKNPPRLEKKAPSRAPKRTSGTGAPGARKSDLLEEAINHMNAGKYGRSSGALKELLTIDPDNQEARRLFATLQLRIGSLVAARTAFESMVQEAMQRQDYWLAESLLREYLAAGPRCVPFLDLLGQVFEIKGDQEAAVKEYAKAVEILIEDPDPDHSNQAAVLFDKILSIEGRSPLVVRLESLMVQATEVTRSSPAMTSEREDGLSSGAASTSLTSQEESHSVAIPPTDAATAASAESGRTRLPWEEDGHEITVQATKSEEPERSPAAQVREESFSPPPVGSAGEGGGDRQTAQTSGEVPQPVSETRPLSSEVDAPALVMTKTETTSAPLLETEVSSPELSTTFGISPVIQAAEEVGDAGPPAEVSASESAVAPDTPPMQQSPTLPIPSWEEILSQYSTAAATEGASPTPTKPVEALIRVPDSLSTSPPSEPTVPEPGTVPLLAGAPTAEVPPVPAPPTSEEPVEALTAISTPTDSIDLSPVLDLTTGSRPESPTISSAQAAAALEDPIIVIPPTMTDSAAASAGTELGGNVPIAAPMPWEQVEEQAIVVPAAEAPVSAQPEEPVMAVATTATSQSDSTGPVAAMPWDQVVEEPIEVPVSFDPVPSESITEPPREVSSNDHLIATILEQTELKEAPVVAKGEAGTGSSGVVEPVAMVVAPASPVEHEPASIRELLDRAMVREEPVPPPALPPHASVEESAPPIVPAAHIPEPVLEVRPLVREEVPDTVATSEAPAASAEPVSEPPAPEPEQKKGFSFFPSVLRLAGVGSTKAEAAPVSANTEESSAAVIASIPVAEPLAVTTEDATVPESSVEAAFASRLEDPAVPVSAPPLPSHEVPPAAPQPALVAPPSEPQSQPEPVPAVAPPLASSEPFQEVQAEAASSTEATGRTELAAPIPPAASQPGAEEEAEAEEDRPQAPVASSRKRRDRKRRAKSHPVSTLASHAVPDPEPAPMPLAAAAPAALPQEPTVAPMAVATVESPATQPVELVTEAATPPPIPTADAVKPATIRPQEPSPVSSPEPASLPPKPKPVRKHSVVTRLWWQLTSVVQACFTTAHALTVTAISMAALTVGVAVLVVGGLGVLWLGMEEKPSPPYQELTAAQPQTAGDVKRSGYALFLGMGVAETKDPVQAGVERHGGAGPQADRYACYGAVQSASLEQGAPAAATLGSWYREPQPASILAGKGAAIKEWIAEASTGLGRYRQWAGTTFEDAGYGRSASPDCGRVLYLHRLHVAEGFAQGQEPGIDRVQADLVQWRSVLRKARTLEAKMLAVAAVNDDLRVLSGLLLLPDLDGKYLPALAKAAVPLDQAEGSMRWPMQSQFVVQKGLVEAALKSEGHEERPWHVAGIAAMPVPKQRLLNRYADYYDALIKSAETSREKFAAPSLYSRIHAPAQGVGDYVSNPINNVLEVDTGPAWETYVGQVRETDALLRLVSLQTWLRKTASESTGDVKARVAKAGQNFYDPFTGFPMLINVSKGLLYSVGSNGRDDDGSPTLDVAVGIPQLPASPVSSGSSKK